MQGTAAAALGEAITCADVLLMLGETSSSGGVTTASLGHYIAAHGLAPQPEGGQEEEEERSSDADAPGPSHRCRLEINVEVVGLSSCPSYKSRACPAPPNPTGPVWDARTLSPPKHTGGPFGMPRTLYIIPYTLHCLGC